MCVISDITRELLKMFRSVRVTLKRNTGKIPVAVSMSRASVRNAPMIKEPERSDRFMVDLLEEVRYANGPDLASISF